MHNSEKKPKRGALKLWLTGMLICVLSFMLVACGGNTEYSKSDDVATSAEENVKEDVATPEPTAEPVKEEVVEEVVEEETLDASEATPEDTETAAEEERWDVSKYPEDADGIYREIGHEAVMGEKANVLAYILVPEEYSNYGGAGMELKFFFGYEGPMCLGEESTETQEGVWLHYLTDEEWAAIESGDTPDYIPSGVPVWETGYYESDENDPIAVYKEYTNEELEYMNEPMNFQEFYVRMSTYNFQYIWKELPGVGNIWQLRATTKPGTFSPEGDQHYRYLSDDTLSLVNTIDDFTLEDQGSRELFLLYGDQEDFENEEYLKALQDFAKERGVKPPVEEVTE